MAFVDQALGLAGAAGQQLFPIARVIKLVRQGSRIVNSTNPLAITANITLTVIDCCSPPPVRLVSTCLALTASAVSAVTAPNSVSVGATIHFANEIYDNCL